MKKFNVIFSMLGIFVFVIPVSNAQLSAEEPLNPCITCEQLIELSLPEVRITSAEKNSENNTYCHLKGVIGKEIKFEMLLPDNWNVRYIMEGKGGFAGRIPDFNMHWLKRGYVISGTNTGHDANPAHAAWALNDMERQVNFAHLAVHRTAVVSKAIINHYYGQFPEYNYFIGCSNGGRQALIEAQRYPEDFNGIVANAPVLDFSSFAAKSIQICQLMFPNPDNFEDALISRSQLEILQNTVLEQCDEIDGVKDRILNDPRECEFDFSRLPLCSENPEDTVCFTPEQIEGIKMLYAGLIIDGKEVHPGFPLGSELAWWSWIAGPSKGAISGFGFPTLHYAFGTEWFKYIIYNDPEWDYSSYDFSSYSADSEFAQNNFSASSINYQAYDSLGGKLIIHHGWSDPALSVHASIQHIEAVQSFDPSVDNYLKLYLLPGVFHCGGGPGAGWIDWIRIMSSWVENGQAPGKIINGRYKNNEMVWSRPFFPYPSVTVYDGSGDPNEESSYIEQK